MIFFCLCYSNMLLYQSPFDMLKTPVSMLAFCYEKLKLLAVYDLLKLTHFYCSEYAAIFRCLLFPEYSACAVSCIAWSCDFGTSQLSANSTCSCDLGHELMSFLLTEMK